MTISATIDGSSKSATISLSWTFNPVYVYRVDGDTGTMTPVRQAEPATLVSNAWTGVDYEIPLGKNFYYLASYGISQITSTTYFLDNSNRECWLRHLTNDLLSTQIFFTTVPELSREVSQDSISVLNRPAPLVVSGDSRKTVSGTLEIYTQGADEVAKLWNLFADCSVLLLQTPEDYLLDINTYISIGAVGVTSPHGKSFIPLRAWSIPFQVVDRPSGTGTSIGGLHVTYAALAAQYVSYADLATPRAGYPTPTYQTLAYGNGTIPLGPTG